MLLILHVEVGEELGDLLHHFKQRPRGGSPARLVTLFGEGVDEQMKCQWEKVREDKAYLV